MEAHGQAAIFTGFQGRADTLAPVTATVTANPFPSFPSVPRHPPPPTTRLPCCVFKDLRMKPSSGQWRSRPHLPVLLRLPPSGQPFTLHSLLMRCCYLPLSIVGDQHGLRGPAVIPLRRQARNSTGSRSGKL
ncbi:hypothetical protein JZ751_008608 [Albula glossodonta]|uniref:Uncharacterized protein n=1 Tax=Albula glossodonta TaxID=121402 RepID=A0A8T2NZ76_9TELE|nr:hypothetical protein JZ751_008608 [Albula glossodonta]